MVEFSSLVLRVFMMTINNKTKEMTEASAMVDLLIAMAQTRFVLN